MCACSPQTWLGLSTGHCVCTGAPRAGRAVAPLESKSPCSLIHVQHHGLWGVKSGVQRGWDRRLSAIPGRGEGDLQRWPQTPRVCHQSRHPTCSQGSRIDHVSVYTHTHTHAHASTYTHTRQTRSPSIPVVTLLPRPLVHLPTVSAPPVHRPLLFHTDLG